MPIADINPNDKWVTDDQGNIKGVDSGSSRGASYFVTPATDSNGNVVGLLGPDGQALYTAPLADITTVNTPAQNTAALQAAHDALPAYGGEIRLPAGTYILAPGFVATKPIKMTGAGRPGWKGITGGTVLTCSNDGDVLLKFLAEGTTLRDFGVRNTLGTAPTGGAGIQMGDVSNACHGFAIERVSSNAFYDNFDIVNGAEWQINACLSYGHSRSGLHIQNTSENDNGDQCLSNCMIATDYWDATYGIFWESGSGLKVCNNKFNWHDNGGSRYKMGKAIYAAPNIASSQSSLFLIANNSFENCTSHGIHIVGESTTYRFSNVILTGNEFAPVEASNVPAVVMDNMQRVVVDGNIFSQCRGISFTNTDTLMIGPNSWQKIRAGKPFIEIGTGCRSVAFAPQNIRADAGSSAYSRQLWSDSTAVASSGALNLQNRREQVWSREIANSAGTAVTTATTSLYRLILDAYQTLRLRVTIGGKKSDNTPFASALDVLISTDSAGTVTSTVIAAAVKVGTVTLSLDIATVSQTKVNVACDGSGTILYGHCTMNIEGPLVGLLHGDTFSA